MIHIGKLFTQTVGEQVRLCARVTIGDRSTVLWYGVDEKFAQYFTRRADPFVLALLGTAMRRGLDIHCESPVTERLLYQIQHIYIPVLVGVDRSKPIQIHAEEAFGAEENAGAVATGFTGGVDSLHTIMCHMPGKAPPNYALTHLAVMNVGAFKGERYREDFLRACEFARGFAKEQNLELVCIDSNFNESLRTVETVNGIHSFVGEMPYRIFGAALALSGLFSVYYLASGTPYRNFSFEKIEMEETIFKFDFLVAHLCTTDGLRFFSSGGEASRTEKLVAISDWEPAQKWIHACFSAEENCGVCRKCVMAQTVFYSLGTLDKYASRYDLDKFYRNKDAFIAQALMHTGRDYEDDLEKLVRENIEITPEMERRARILSAAVNATNGYFIEKGSAVLYKWIK